MSGIKQIYRSIDAFRLPTYDEVISYSENSIVAHYDSDTGKWRHYISIAQTTAGSLDSDIRSSEWVAFSFDSDTLSTYAQKAVESNYDALVASVDSDFARSLARLDSDNDSDFRVLYAQVDSDVRFLRHHVDSEIAALEVRVNADFDSEVTLLNNTVNNYILEVQYGRVYDSETILSSSLDNRLTNVVIDAANQLYIVGTFLDEVQESTTIQWRAYTNSVLDFASNLQQSVNGAHKVAVGVDSEIITSYFDTPAYVSSISYRGVESGLGGGYFTSAKIKWTFDDATTATFDYPNIVLDNTTRVTLFNPDVSKRVSNIDLTAYTRSNDAPGINYIEITSAEKLEELRAHRANLLHFQTVQDLLRYSPHEDTIALVHSTNSLYHNEDSEWTATDPRYIYVDTSLADLETNFPAIGRSDNIRALTTLNGYEYVVKSGVWTLDVNSVEGYDSDLVHTLDSDFRVLETRFDSFETYLNTQIEALDDRIELNDSELTTIQVALTTFYTDYVALKQEHIIHNANMDSDVKHFDTKLADHITNTNLIIANGQAADAAAFTAFQNTVNTDTAAYAASTTAKVNALKEDHDSDYEAATAAILANSVDISLLRNGQVADNDSDIGVLQVDFANVDSDFNALRVDAMKYKGVVDITDPLDVPANSIKGDVYMNSTEGVASVGWGVLTGNTIPARALVMDTTAYGWTVINSGNNSTGDGNIGVPAGTILSFSSLNAIPSSFHVCDGSVYDPGLYSELYGILGTNTLPDLRGYFLRGHSDDDSVDEEGPRAPLSVQQDAHHEHNHQWHEENAGSDGRIDTAADSFEAATYQADGISYRSLGGNEFYNDAWTSTVRDLSSGAQETRPKNVAVVYAIAMYSGAGSSNVFDSDIRLRQSEMDSDLVIVNHDSKATDSDLRVEIHTRSSVDSDIQVQIVDNDSDILSLQTAVSTLVGQFNLAQFSTTYVVGGAIPSLNVGVEYDITAEVINTATPENFCYPDIQFFYETQGANVNPTAPGRRLDGTNGTPQVSYRVIHDGAGNMAIGINTSATITHDIRIVSTFRTQ